MDERAPDWVRLGVVVTMAVPQLAVGLWAVLAPRSWFDDFPGVGPALVAAEPPYNRHLAGDAGAGFVATGVALLAAAVWAHRAAIRTALLAFVAFTVPHVLYHALHPSELLDASEDLVGVLSLASGLVLAAVFAFGTVGRLSLARPAARAG